MKDSVRIYTPKFILGIKIHLCYTCRTESYDHYRFKSELLNQCGFHREHRDKSYKTKNPAVGRVLIWVSLVKF